MRPCLEPGCAYPKTDDATRCPVHTRSHRRAVTPPNRYGGRYLAHRRIVLGASDLCWRCGRHGADTVDHVVPLAHGGTHALDNLRPAHRHCNLSAGATVRRGRSGFPPPRPP